MSRRNSLHAMRERMASTNPGSDRPKIYSPMNELNVGQSVTLRLAPWNDPVHQKFWTVQQFIWLEFVNPENEAETLKFKVPCLEMYETGVKCPVLSQARALYAQSRKAKETGHTEEMKRLEAVGSAHWAKKSFLYQGWIKGVSEVELTPIRLAKSIHDIIETTFMDTESEMKFDYSPVGLFEQADAVEYIESNNFPDEDLEIFDHTPFVVSKGKRGEHNNYESSNWVRGKIERFTDEQIRYVAQNGFIDLRKLLPNRPTDEQYEVMAEMAAVSIDHALGGGDGLWNPEWEQVGLKPLKKSDGDEEDSQKAAPARSARPSRASTQDRVREKLSAPEEAKPASDVRARLSRARGAAAPEPEQAEVVADPVDEAPRSTSSRMSSITERLKARRAEG